MIVTKGQNAGSWHFSFYRYVFILSNTKTVIGMKNSPILTNIKALCLAISEKKNFEMCHLCSYVPTCEPRGGQVLTPGASS